MTYAFRRRNRPIDLLRRAVQWRPSVGWYRPKLTWIAPLIPLVLVVAAAFVGVQLPKLLGGVVAFLLLLLLVRKPTLCLLAVIPYVTFQQAGLPLLWSFGLPGQVARQLGAVKDLLGIALVIAAILEINRRKIKLDLIDWLALGYIAWVILNAAAPQLFYQLLPTTLNTRLLAFRYDAGYVLLFFAARHAPFAADVREKFTRMLMIATAVLVAGGIWQRFATASFANFLVNTGRIDLYAIDILRVPSYLANSNVFLRAHPLQVGSFVIAAHDFADLMIIAMAFVLERTAREHRWRTSVPVFGVLAAMIIFSGVRADLIAAGVMFALVLLPRRGRTPIARVGLVALLVIGAAMVVPFLGGSRIAGGGTAGISNKAHLGEFLFSIDLMTHNPVGLGLGNNPATADRFQLPYGKQGALTGDNSYFQVGDELGIPATLLYTAMLIAIFAALIRRGRDDPFPNAALLAFTGMWVAGMFHHIFLTFPAAWALWAAVGLALRPTPRRTADDELDAPETAALDAHRGLVPQH